MENFKSWKTSINSQFIFSWQMIQFDYYLGADEDQNTHNIKRRSEFLEVQKSCMYFKTMNYIFNFHLKMGFSENPFQKVLKKFKFPGKL